MMLVKTYGVLEELFDKVNVCHDHAAATISFASKCIHRITADNQNLLFAWASSGVNLPVGNSLINELQVSLP
jgi:hypothetical protein